MKSKVELLCPAGNIQSFKSACQNGADAIYMGVDRFNARAMAKNFTINEYVDCIKYAHIRNIKVYLTLNTLLYDEEIKDALEVVKSLYECGLDAVILQDLGLATLVHKMLPDLHLHASTQMSVYSLEQVKYLEKLGFSRVVLARELTVSEIEYICKNCNGEIEVFVHGALCVCVSGQCYLSKSIGNRSANRGSCAQPCRMKYSLYKNGKIIEKERYLLSKKDIFGMDYIDKLILAGVHSLKLEGRNKSPEYVACVTSSYRKKIDQKINEQEQNNIQNNLLQMFNRDGKSSGYLGGVRYKDSITLNSPKNTGKVLGKVLDKKNKFIKVKLMEDIDLHDGFEIYSDGNVVSSIVTCIRDDKYKITNTISKKGEYVWIGDINKNVKINSLVIKTSSNKLNEEYRKTYENDVQNIKENIYIDISFRKGKNVKIKYFSKNNEVLKDEIFLEYIPDIAKNKALTKEDVDNSFKKTIDIPFNFILDNADIENGLFVPVSMLNEIRRNIYASILSKFECKKNIDINYDKVLKFDGITKKRKIDFNNSLFVYKYDKEKTYNLEYDFDVLIIQIQDYIRYSEDIINKYINNNIKIAISIPNVVFDNVNEFINENIEKVIIDNKISGVILGSFRYFEKLKKLKEKYNFYLIADYSFNVTNKYSAMFLKNIGFDAITLCDDSRLEDFEKYDKFINVVIIQGYKTIMTSRYCIIGSFVENRKVGSACKRSCMKESFYIEDFKNTRYDIVCDSIDCVMRIVKNDDKTNDNNFGIKRNCIL